MQKAAIYARVSPPEDARVSIDRQINSLTDYAKVLEVEITEIYKDHDMTGSTMDRNDLVIMCHEAMQGKFKFLLVENNDRLSRNVEDLHRIVRELKKSGVTVIFQNIPQGVETPEGKFTMTVLGGASEYFLDDLRRKTSNSMSFKRSIGYWMGRFPMGFALKDVNAVSRYYYDNFVVINTFKPILKDMLSMKRANFSYRKISRIYGGMDHKKIKRIIEFYNWLDKQYCVRGLNPKELLI